MRIYLAILLSFYFSENSFSQNLLANGSFEDENICDEYHANCAPAAWEGTSWDRGYIMSQRDIPDGNHYVNILMDEVDTHHRTYPQSRLLCQLTKGKTYLIDFFVNSNHIELKNIDVLFSDKEIFFSFSKHYADSNLISMSESNSIEQFDKTKWNEMNFVYTATGKEKYIVIGNFQANDEIFLMKSANSIKGELIYSVDFISLVPIDSNAVLCNESDFDLMKTYLYSQHRRHSYGYNFSYPDFIIPNDIVDTIPIPQIIESKTDTITLSDILFETDSSQLNSAMVYLLDSVAAIINAGNYKLITVIGYTDNVGSDSYNLMLSIHRSASVADYFKNEKNISASLIKNYGMGKRDPVADNSTAEGRSKNRRVEIILQKE